MKGISWSEGWWTMTRSLIHVHNLCTMYNVQCILFKRYLHDA